MQAYDNLWSVWGWLAWYTGLLSYRGEYHGAAILRWVLRQDPILFFYPGGRDRLSTAGMCSRRSFCMREKLENGQSGKTLVCGWRWPTRVPRFLLSLSSLGICSSLLASETAGVKEYLSLSEQCSWDWDSQNALCVFQPKIDGIPENPVTGAAVFPFLSKADNFLSFFPHSRPSWTSLFWILEDQGLVELQNLIEGTKICENGSFQIIL